MDALKLMTRADSFTRHYGNPLEILVSRTLRRKKVRVVDRASKVWFTCNQASFNMMGETWYDHDYDVPRMAIRPGDVVIDIGANQGFFSCYAAQRGARVYAYEPSPGSFAQLQENIRNNGFADRIEASQVGVGAEEGTAALTVSERLGGGMDTIVPAFVRANRLKSDRQISVPLTTLPLILQSRRLDHVRICKLDCEGAESMILQSLDAKTADRVDAFVIEYHWGVYPLPELLDHMMGWGTHQVSFAEDKFCMRTVLRVVRNDIVRESP